ncbi:hypothetical protein BU16DRAFT_577817 [Lophium mytilinum]|uniref:N-acetyltransferase domain-containing protein n=1 Tax=Lophium mytilinum TaxID=390894 RepID=A0A6A6RA73_9PEZI|nr:hypothetical protein BU16DRAFT_577817 [Lophium mytilinum]
MSILLPGYSIHPITTPDIPTISSFVAASKLPLAINRFLFKDWPNEAIQLAHSTKAVEASFQASGSKLLKVVDDETGEIVGHLVTTRKAGKEKVRRAEGEGVTKGGVPEYIVPEVSERVMSAARELEGGVEGRGVDYLTLTHSYVRPSHRGRGIWSSLMKLLLEKGKQAGVPVFVCSEPQMRRSFLELGFEETGYVDIDLREWAEEKCGWGVFRLSGLVSEE